MLVTLPEMVLPCFSTELATSTPMNDGRGGAAGLLLFPGDELHVPPHVGGVALKVSANPLNAEGASPPLRAFSDAHCAPQNVTSVVGVAAATVALPSTNAPVPAKAKTIAGLLSEEGR